MMADDSRTLHEGDEKTIADDATPSWGVYLVDWMEQPPVSAFTKKSRTTNIAWAILVSRGLGSEVPGVIRF